MIAEKTILPVILAGGPGTRLMPIASDACPKPFVPLPNGSSLLSETCRRVKDARFAPPILVGAQSYRFALLNHARAAGIAPSAILLEPAARNTAMAVAVAAAHALNHQPGAMLVVLPCDQVLAPLARWQEAVVRAAAASKKSGRLCLLAVPPMSPSAEFGYMALKPGGDWQEVTKFVEKPSDAAGLLASSPAWAWNIGQFIAPAEIIAALFEQHAPQIWQAACASLAAARREWEFTLLSAISYGNASSLSFDRAVVEKARAIALTPLIDWSDLGTLAAWDEYTNGWRGNGRPRTDRPWGFFELMEERPSRLTKKLTIYPGCRLSRQRHFHRQEEWEVLKGSALVECDEKVDKLEKGNSIFIAEGSWHRLANIGTEELIIKEIQLGNPDENDIERSDDDYGRA